MAQCLCGAAVYVENWSILRQRENELFKLHSFGTCDGIPDKLSQRKVVIKVSKFIKLNNRAVRVCC